MAKTYSKNIRNRVSNKKNREKYHGHKRERNELSSLKYLY